MKVQRSLLRAQVDELPNNKVREDLKRLVEHYPEGVDLEFEIALSLNDGYTPPDRDGTGESEEEPVVTVIIKCVPKVFGPMTLQYVREAVPLLASALYTAKDHERLEREHKDSYDIEIEAALKELETIRRRRRKAFEKLRPLNCVLIKRSSGHIVALGKCWSQDEFLERAKATEPFKHGDYHVQDCEPEQYEYHVRLGKPVI